MPNDAAPLADVDPDEVAPDDCDAEEIRAALTAETGLTRARGLRVCGRMARENVGAVAPHLESIGALAADDHAPAALAAVEACQAVADADPAALVGHLGGLVDALAHDVVDVRGTAARALATVALERPALLQDHLEGMVAAVAATEPAPAPDDDYDEVVDDEWTRETVREHEMDERERRIEARRTAADVVVAVTEADGRAGVPVVAPIADLLGDEDPQLTVRALAALSEVGAADPAALESVREAVADRLDHERSVVRAHAVRAVSVWGDRRAREALEPVAASDPDEDVRELAAAALAALPER